MHTNIKTSLTKAQFPTPLYSPRTTYSNHLRQISQLKTNMIISIDKYILGNLKAQFDKRAKEITLVEFVYFAKKYLKNWNNQLYGRDVKMDECLLEVWREIDIENTGKITWEQFNSKIIQTSLNLKSLSNNAGIQAPSFKQLVVPLLPGKYENPIAKIVQIKGKGKMAFFRQEAIQIEFFSTDTTSEQSPQTKPLLLPQQQLKVQTMIKVKDKSEQLTGDKIRQVQKMVKKDLKVSSYKNTVIDAIYIDDKKYDMLMVSSSDKFVRGYDVSSMLPVIQAQPQNQDEQMVHQFPIQVYTMAWDPVNEVLYATGKYPKIYQWVIKTDSQREMMDAKGHESMISVMLMMPKLQLLATGGYDGKLVLWDTVGQVAKCRYQEHVRAVSSIAFHQGLILLFTASYDHKICIWNPYITSLIHKIDNTLNVISIEIIPNTNYLLTLDCGGTVKIRQINRFTQVTSFSILRSDVNEDTESLNKQDKTDRQISITMCSKKDGTIQYYFGMEKILGYEYFEIEKSSIVGGNVTEMKYDARRFKMFTPLKNHVVVWNLLTGRMEEVFYDMAEGDITVMEVATELGYFVVGDIEGNLVQRKLSNGFIIKSLPKIKGAVNLMKLHELSPNQKQKSIKKTYLLLCTTQQGQVTIFKSYPKTQFTLHKQFSIRGDFGVRHGNLVGIQFFALKNLLAMRLNTNEVLFVDVEKRTLLIKIEFGEMVLGGMNLVDCKDSHYIVVWNKSGQVTSFYLPPHPKKFKTSCRLQIESLQKPQLSVYAAKSNLYFLSTQQSEVCCIDLPQKYLQVDSYTPSLKVEWKVKMEKRVVAMMMIENETVLEVLIQGEEVVFLAVKSGDVLGKLRHEFKGDGLRAREQEPILHFREKTHQVYIPNEDKIVKIEIDQLEDTKYQRILNPHFFINYITNKNIKNFNKTSSTHWDLHLDFNKLVDKRINQIHQIQVNLNNSVEKMFQKRGPNDLDKKIQKAFELHKKWQKEKDLQTNAELVRNPQSMSKLQRTSKNLNPNLSRANSISMLWKAKQRKSQYSLNKEKKSLNENEKKSLKENDLTGTKSKFSEKEKIDFRKMTNDPMYRLGQALKSLNIRDKKADQFIQMSRKKQELKLPKINSQKIKI